MSDTIDEPEPFMTDDGLIDVIHTPNGLDDYDIEPAIPQEERITHVIDLDQEIRYRWDDEEGRMVMDRAIF